MKKFAFYFLLFFSTAFTGCISDDLIDDFVDPVLRISQTIDTLGFGDNFSFQSQFFNNVGQSENLDISWTSSDETIISIDNTGNASGLQTGNAVITAMSDYEGQSYSDQIIVAVGEETVIAPTERSGVIEATSFYTLEGDFILKEENGTIQLDFADNYEASSNLPGLYVYLTNNPNTINDALEIGRVNVFSGAHSYEIPGNPDLNEYQYVLYFCKPFNVKVGDGEISN